MSGAARPRRAGALPLLSRRSHGTGRRVLARVLAPQDEIGDFLLPGKNKEVQRFTWRVCQEGNQTNPS